MKLSEVGTVVAGISLDLSVVDGEPLFEEPVCDGCGQPAPCATATHAHRMAWAADFARSYSGL